MVSSSPIGHSSLCSRPPPSSCSAPSSRLPTRLRLRGCTSLLVSPSPPSSGRRAFLWVPMEQPEISFSSPEMEQTGIFWMPLQQAEQGLEDLLSDLELSHGNGTACGLQMENYRARDDDAVLILKLLEEPRDEADLDEWLSGCLHPSPLWGTLCHHQMECRKSGRRGARKRRTSPWDTLFFREISLRSGGGYITRKNNSHWTAKEVKLLVQGVTNFGVGRWSQLKKKYFKTSVRTAVNIKDKWRNLVRAYKGNAQKYTLLELEPPLVEQIRKLASKHPYPKQRHS